jgi:glycopeptide antibiotics resistance protein
MTLTPAQPHEEADQALQRTVETVTGHPSAVSTTTGVTEQLANVALFVPVGFLVTLLLPRRRRWLAVPTAAVLSGLIETLQATVVTTRNASPGDVLMNTLGGIAGFGLALAALARTRRRARPRLSVGARAD